KMNVIVWALEPNGLHPRVDVFDAAGNAAASQLLANENGSFSVEVENTTPGATYYVKIGALGDGHDTGNYFLGVDFNTDVATAAPPVNYLLTGRMISDPIGPRPDDGSGTSSDPTAWDGSTGTTTDPNWDQPYYW